MTHKVGVIGNSENALEIAELFIQVGADVDLFDPANVATDMEKVGDFNFILDCTEERLEPKRQLYAAISGRIRRDAVLASNSTSILRSDLVKELSESLGSRFVIASFAEPPRHSKLVEIVCENSPENSPVDSLISFLREKMGRGVVLAKDTPLLIANRIGIYNALDILHTTFEEGWPVEAVDAVISRTSGFFPGGVFHTIDRMGVDSLTFKATELVKLLMRDDSLSDFRIPQFLHQMVVKGYSGEKSKKGFYCSCEKSGRRLVFNPQIFDYRPMITFSTKSLLSISELKNPKERLRQIVFAKDQVGEIVWPTVSRMLVYAANSLPEIADDVARVDNAMKWGFGWEMGPFEMWDALGVRTVLSHLEEDYVPIPPLILKLLGSGGSSFYEWRGNSRFFFDFAKKARVAVPVIETETEFWRLKEQNKILRMNKAASLIDMDSGIFALELSARNGVLDADALNLLEESVDYVEGYGLGLVILSLNSNFASGFDFMPVLKMAGEGRWQEVDLWLAGLQNISGRIHFCKRPVVALPSGDLNGVGLSLCLSAGKICAAAETYFCFDELRLGLLPLGGALGNLILRLEDNGLHHGPHPKVKDAFKIIAGAKKSASALDARTMGFLSESDEIFMNWGERISAARGYIKKISGAYAPPQSRDDILLPGHGGYLALANNIREMEIFGRISKYDARVLLKLAHVLTGGDVPTIHKSSERRLLDLEREAVLSLMGEAETQTRLKDCILR